MCMGAKIEKAIFERMCGEWYTFRFARIEKNISGMLKPMSKVPNSKVRNIRCARMHVRTYVCLCARVCVTCRYLLLILGRGVEMFVDGLFNR